MIDIHGIVNVIALPLYIIAFIGFIENINEESKVKIEYFEKHNINTNLVKIIVLSILSVILVFEIRKIASTVILALVYLIITSVKLIQVKKKKQIAMLWGISIILAILLTVLYVGSPLGIFRLNRITTSFAPEVDPDGAGWQGMQQRAIINSANPFGKADYKADIINFFNSATYHFAFIAVLANYGWVMAITMIIMVFAFNIKLIFDARKIKDKYGKLLMIGIASLFIFRSTFCILMNFNLGIKADFDIPFISYGEINLIMDIMSLALIFSIYRKKDIIVKNSNVMA